jgi:hypothetical protein
MPHISSSLGLRRDENEHLRGLRQGGQKVVITRLRLFRLALLAAILVAVIVVTSAGGASPKCTAGVSSVGPAVLVNGQLATDQSDLTPVTQACLQEQGPSNG